MLLFPSEKKRVSHVCKLNKSHRFHGQEKLQEKRELEWELAFIVEREQAFSYLWFLDQMMLDFR